MVERKVVYVDVHERGLFMIDEDPKECDFCDKVKVCASINTITIDVMCVCEDCLQKFVNAFNSSELKVMMPSDGDEGDEKDWICKDCNGVFKGKKITCTCEHGIYG